MDAFDGQALEHRHPLAAGILGDLEPDLAVTVAQGGRVRESPDVDHGDRGGVLVTPLVIQDDDTGVVVELLESVVALGQQGRVRKVTLLVACDSPRSGGGSPQRGEGANLGPSVTSR